MSIHVLQDRQIKAARKDYECDACLWLLHDDIRSLHLTFTEWRQVIKARANGWKIKKGEPYTYQRNLMDGDFRTFRAIPEIHKICVKYEMYDLNI